MKIHFPNNKRNIIIIDEMGQFCPEQLGKSIFHCSCDGAFYFTGCSACKEYIIEEMTEDEVWLEET